MPILRTFQLYGEQSVLLPNGIKHTLRFNGQILLRSEGWKGRGWYVHITPDRTESTDIFFLDTDDFKPHEVLAEYYSTWLIELEKSYVLVKDS